MLHAVGNDEAVFQGLRLEQLEINLPLHLVEERNPGAQQHGLNVQIPIPSHSESNQAPLGAKCADESFNELGEGICHGVFTFRSYGASKGLGSREVYKHLTPSGVKSGHFHVVTSTNQIFLHVAPRFRSARSEMFFMLSARYGTVSLRRSEMFIARIVPKEPKLL